MKKTILMIAIIAFNLNANTQDNCIKHLKQADKYIKMVDEGMDSSNKNLEFLAKYTEFANMHMTRYTICIKSDDK